jgi:hypothetical protein
VCSTAVRKANREAVDVLGGKSMILVCIFTPLKALVSSAVHRVTAESCNENADSAVIAGNAVNVSRKNSWRAASLPPSRSLRRQLARPTGWGPWWGEAPERLKGFTGQDGLKGLAARVTPGRLPSRGSVAFFSVYALPHPKPAAPTTPPNRRLTFASISATSDKSASFYALV